MFKPLGEKLSSLYCQKLSRILFPPVSLSIILTQRFNNYKACNRKFSQGSSVPQAEFFRHFSGEGHRGFLQDIRVSIIDRLTGGNRMRESFWQYKLDSFSPKGLNTRHVDT